MCHIVYTAMECQDVLMKPNLAFKLPNMMKSSSVTCLQTEGEWQDLIKAVEQVEAKGGDPEANIMISKKVCHFCYSKSMILTLSCSIYPHWQTISRVSQRMGSANMSSLHLSTCLMMAWARPHPLRAPCTWRIQPFMNASKTLSAHEASAHRWTPDGWSTVL